MGSQVLKLLPTTWNFWLLSPSSSSELLLPSQAMVIMAVVTMEGTMEDTMVATEDTTTARGPLMLRLRLMPSPPPLPSPDMVTTVATWADITLTDTDMLLLTPMDITVTTARDLLMLSPDMATTAMEVTMEDTVGATMATVATEDTTTARGLPMLSPDTATTVMGTEATVEDTMVMVMVTATDITVEKFQKFMLIQSD